MCTGFVVSNYDRIFCSDPEAYVEFGLSTVPGTVTPPHAHHAILRGVTIRRKYSTVVLSVSRYRCGEISQLFFLRLPNISTKFY
jgi:hypothetical protein